MHATSLRSCCTELNVSVQSLFDGLETKLSDLPFLEKWSGETTAELIKFDGQYRVDSIVLAFEWAVQAKLDNSPVSTQERYILAVEALEREVNNGGFSQFFLNSSNEFIDVVEASLRAIGCPQTAEITKNAILALGRGPSITADHAEEIVSGDDPEVDAALEECDNAYFENEEPIADRLFAWIKANESAITVGAV